MKKSEIVWLLIRLIGLYFAYLSVLNIVGFITAFFTLVSQPVYQRQFIIIVLPLVWISTYSTISLYMLTGGKHLFVILNREDSANSLEDDLKNANKQKQM